MATDDDDLLNDLAGEGGTVTRVAGDVNPTGFYTQTVAVPTAQTDTLTVRLVVVFLGLAVLGALAAVAWLVAGGKDPGAVATIGTTALGALAAVLVSTRSAKA